MNTKFQSLTKILKHKMENKINTPKKNETSREINRAEQTGIYEDAAKCFYQKTEVLVMTHT